MEKAHWVKDANDIAEKLLDLGYTPKQFKDFMRRLIYQEMEHIERQHCDREINLYIADEPLSKG